MVEETALERFARLLRKHRPHEVTIDRAEREMGEPARSLQRAETGRWLPHRRFMEAWERRFGDHPDVWEAYETAQAEYRARKARRAERRRSVTTGPFGWGTLAYDSPSHPQDEENADMDRREVVKAGAATLAGFALPTARGTAGVTQLEDLTDSLRALYRTVPFPRMREPVEAHIRLLRASVPGRESDRQRVLAALSATASTAGYMFWDGFGNRPKGRAYHALALAAGRESGVAPVVAMALRGAAAVDTGDGDRGGATAALDEANRLAAKHAPLGLRSYLMASRAELAAQARDEKGTLRRLAVARTLLDRSGQERAETVPYGWRNLSWGWGEMNLRGFEGTCYAQLNDGVRAEESIGHAMHDAEARGAPAHYQAVFLADLAAALVAQGKLDEGCAAAGRALGMHGRSVQAVDRVRELVLGPLRRHQSVPCVLDLQERLLSIR